jgi:hypothetical protein
MEAAQKLLFKLVVKTYYFHFCGCVCRSGSVECTRVRGHGRKRAWCLKALLQQWHKHIHSEKRQHIHTHTHTHAWWGWIRRSHLLATY